MSIVNTSCDNFLLLEYWNECDHANFLYQTGWKQRVFIDSDIVKPSYNITEEGYEDGEGNFIPTFKREQKVFVVEWLVYEYLLDAIYTIPQHDHKWIYLKNGDSEEIQDLTIEHEWVTSGVAKITMNFRTRYILKNNCCSNLDITCYESTVNVVDVIDNYTSAVWVDPVGEGVNPLDVYLVEDYNYTPHRYFVAQWNTGSGWTTLVYPIGTILTNLTDNSTWYNDGLIYHQYPVITTINSVVAGTIFIRGYVLPSTYVKVYYKKAADSNYSLCATIYNANTYIVSGVNITGLLPATSYNVKIESYNHNCNYGYSAVGTVTTA